MINDEWQYQFLTIGELPSHVLVHDIDPVIDLTSAHER